MDTEARLKQKEEAKKIKEEARLKQKEEARLKQKEEAKKIKEQKEKDALDVDKQYDKLVAQEKVKEAKQKAKRRLDDERAPQLNPARELEPLPSNYQPLRELDKVNFGENRRTYLGTSAMSLKKPLAPNVLDVAAIERGKELAAQRRQAGHKWVQLIPR